MRSNSSSWISKFATLGFPRKFNRPTKASSPNYRRLRLESLEPRHLLSITVNTHIDENDGINVGGVSLRDAVAHAATQPGSDIIEFNPSLSGSTIELLHGEIPINSDVSIIGLGQDQLTIDARGASRIFSVSGITAYVGGLTLTGGNTTAGGGAINNWGNLTVDYVTLLNNHSGYRGGAIYSGTLRR
jgi:predicted outer membrane repeat protein